MSLVCLPVFIGVSIHQTPPTNLGHPVLYQYGLGLVAATCQPNLLGMHPDSLAIPRLLSSGQPSHLSVAPASLFPHESSHIFGPPQPSAYQLPQLSDEDIEFLNASFPGNSNNDFNSTPDGFSSGVAPTFAAPALFPAHVDNIQAGWSDGVVGLGDSTGLDVNWPTQQLIVAAPPNEHFPPQPALDYTFPAIPTVLSPQRQSLPERLVPINHSGSGTSMPIKAPVVMEHNGIDTSHQMSISASDGGKSRTLHHPAPVRETQTIPGSRAWTPTYRLQTPVFNAQPPEFQDQALAPHARTLTSRARTPYSRTNTPNARTRTPIPGARSPIHDN
ncbi:hypothetical protein BDV93DRAFT_551328 [Ceratobasidium sp. AG-I]|nr:hypothetical protein BDV93DRAFT_551328 [Ceratobasidium sp. AG-I]